MKNYAKVGNRAGRPAYRTASQFRYKKWAGVLKAKAKTPGHKKSFE